MQNWCLLDGPNAFGAGLLAKEHNGTTFSQAVADGKVKGIIAVEAEISSELLEGIPFVAALDWRNTDTVKSAWMVLPTTAWVEMDGTYINNEGRAQRFKKVMTPVCRSRGSIRLCIRRGSIPPRFPAAICVRPGKY